MAYAIVGVAPHGEHHIAESKEDLVRFGQAKLDGHEKDCAAFEKKVAAAKRNFDFTGQNGLTLQVYHT